MNKLKYQLILRKRNRGGFLSVVMLKPATKELISDEFLSYLSKKGLQIVSYKEMILSKEAILALYPKIFSFDASDLKYGLRWKKQTLKYLSSGLCSTYLIKGKDAFDLLSRFKKQIRSKYGKVTYPDRKMTEKEFYELCVKNLIHQVDEEGLEIALWLLFND